MCFVCVCVSVYVSECACETMPVFIYTMLQKPGGPIGYLAQHTLFDQVSNYCQMRVIVVSSLVC